MREDVRWVGNPLDVPKDPSADLGNFSALFGMSNLKMNIKIFFLLEIVKNDVKKHKMQLFPLHFHLT